MKDVIFSQTPAAKEPEEKSSENKTESRPESWREVGNPFILDLTRYRRLREDEILKEGDEFWHGNMGRWVKTRAAGHPVDAAVVYRRGNRNG